MQPPAFCDGAKDMTLVEKFVTTEITESAEKNKNKSILSLCDLCDLGG